MGQQNEINAWSIRPVLCKLFVLDDASFCQCIFCLKSYLFDLHSFSGAQSCLCLNEIACVRLHLFVLPAYFVHNNSFTNGIVQTVNYISDAMGFRVAATNLPVHNVDAAPAAAPVAVAAAPVTTAAAPVAAAAAPVVSAAVSAYHAGDVIAPQVQYSYLPYAQNYAYHTPATAVVKAAPSRPVVSVTHSAPAPVVHSAPVVQAAAPVTYAAAPVHVTPAAVQGSQYHAQDDAGQYSFGYNDGSSVKQEIKTADGVIRGAYSYVDADGIVQNVNYIADALGFRVGATTLPVHHVDAPVEAAAPVQ